MRLNGLAYFRGWFWQPKGGRQEDIYAAIFIAWMKDLEQVVLEISPGMLVVQMKVDQKLYPKMNHFVCFLPGSIFLGIDLARDEKQRELWKKMAEGITATCRTMYTNTKSGLSGMLGTARERESTAFIRTNG